MIQPHRIFDGTWDYGEIATHVFRVVGGDLGSKTPVGHKHAYPHMLLVRKVEPVAFDVTVWAIQDGQWVKLPTRPGDAWYVEAGVQHYAEVPPGCTADILCIFSNWGPDGKRFNPKSYRAPSVEPEPWQ